MHIHELKRKTPNRDKALIGRGGKRGKTSGRGTKGQKARAGRKMRPEMRDIIKRIPKLRGHGKNRARTVNSERVKPLTLDLSFFEGSFEKGVKVTPMMLVEQNLVRVRGNKMPAIKILGTGDITKSLALEGFLVSEVAKQKIEKAGGSVA